MSSEQEVIFRDGTGTSDDYYKQFQQAVRYLSPGDQIRFEGDSRLQIVVFKQALFFDGEGFRWAIYTVGKPN